MYREFYAGAALLDLPLFTLILFVTLFVTVVARTFLLRRSRDFDGVAQLPLGEDRHE